VIDGRSYPWPDLHFRWERIWSTSGEPIDIVYTWVDGEDPDWQKAFRAAAATAGTFY
jgi:hypothetical protein